MKSSKLDYLGFRFGLFHEGHRARADVDLLLALLAQAVPETEESILAVLLASARAPSWRVHAVNLPIANKDYAAARGYRWNDGKFNTLKAWWIETRDEPAEREFLAGLGCRSPHVVRETARERYRSLAARAEDETDRGTDRWASRQPLSHHEGASFCPRCDRLNGCRRPNARCECGLPLTDIHPLPIRHFGQRRRADPDGTVDGSRRREHFIEFVQRRIEIDRNRPGQPERTDAAHGMPGQCDDLVRGQHPSPAKHSLELAMVDPGVATGDQDDHAAVVQPKRKSLRNAARLDLMGFCSQFDGCRARLEFDDRDVETADREEVADRLQAHVRLFTPMWIRNGGAGPPRAPVGSLAPRRRTRFR